MKVFDSMNALFRIVFIFYVLCFSLFSPSCTEAQVAQTFNSGGQHTSGTNVLVSSSLGEVFVDTYQMPDLKISEGILTSSILVMGLEQNETIPLASVYPNPFKNELTIETLYAGSKFTILTMTGMILRQGLLNEFKTSIKFQEAPSQLYILKVEEKKNGKTTIFKIRHEN